MSSTQTMKSWARAVKSFEDVPEFFKEHFSEFAGETVPFPCTIFVPFYEWGNKDTLSKMVCILDDRIGIIEKSRKGNAIKVILYSNINYIETGSELLYSWIKVESEENGELVTGLIEYGTVVNEVFSTVIEKVRKTIIKFEDTDLLIESCKFNYLGATDYRFMNLGRNSIHRGEKIIKIMVQKPINRYSRSLYGEKAHKSITNAHMSILTDKELILIADTNQKHTGRGFLCRYIPLNRIEGVSSNASKLEDALILTLTLIGGVTIDLLFEGTNNTEVDSFQTDLSNCLRKLEESINSLEK